MREWKFWDWVAYACLLVSAILVVAKEPAEKVPVMHWLSDPIWSFIPLILVILASLLLGARALGWIGGKTVYDSEEKRLFQEKLKIQAHQNRLAMTGQGTQSVEAPHPIFGSPRQMASEHFRSWWHIPITLSEGTRRIENCTIELNWDAHSGPPTRMQWQSIGNPSGVYETMLVEGREYLVPVALRDEPVAGPRPIPASITGTAYLVDDNNKFILAPGRRLFRLTMRSGTSSWQSQHRYSLTVPPAEHSNGHFVMEIWHEGRA